MAASVFQGVGDVQFIRKALGLRGRSIRIISKVKNEDGVMNMDAIIQESDGIMVVRGDLGTEFLPV